MFLHKQKLAPMLCFQPFFGSMVSEYPKILLFIVYIEGFRDMANVAMWIIAHPGCRLPKVNITMMFLSILP